MITRKVALLTTTLALAATVDAYGQPMAATTKSTFTNGDVNTLPLDGRASAYPSSIAVAGVAGQTYHVSVEMRLAYPGPQRLSLVLKAPSGKAVMLMGDVGGSFGPSAFTSFRLGYDDCAPVAFPVSGMREGRYRPSSLPALEPMPSPAPAGPYATGLAMFNWESPNGTWELYAATRDQTAESQILSWTLTIFAQSAPYPSVAGRNPVSCSTPDYDGDGRIDIAVYRPETGEWFVAQSGSSGAPRVVSWGAAESSGLGDVPVPADYDGDGITDFGIWRRANSTWLLTASFSEFTGGYYCCDWLGSAALGDVPVPGDYDGDGFAEPAVYRASTGEWFIRYKPGLNRQSTTRWGSPASGDVPARR
jgi:hypothetical protein